MTPWNLRRLRALDRASLYAKEARAMLQEAYMADQNSDRRAKLDEALVALQMYEDMASIDLNKAYEQLAKDQK